MNLATQTFDFASASLLVQSFDISALAHLERSVHKDLEERQPGACMDLLCLLTILEKKENRALQPNDIVLKSGIKGRAWLEVKPKV